MITHAAFVLAGALSVFASMPSAAAPLPAYHVSGDVFFNLSPPAPPRVNVVDFGSVSLAHPDFGVLSANGAGAPSPSLQVSAALGPSEIGIIYGRADLLLDYAFEIVGPPGTVSVLVDVTGSASATATAGASFVVESRWDLFDTFTGASVAGDDVRSGQMSGSFSEGFSRTVSLTLATNRVYTVSMFADAQAAATEVGSQAAADAFIDPVLRFGADVDPERYAFSFSAGIGNASNVPEPATLVLLCAGIAGLALRQSRAWPATPALGINSPRSANCSRAASAACSATSSRRRRS